MGSAADRHRHEIEAVRHAILEVAASTPIAVRRSALSGEPLPGPVGAYLAKVRRQAPTITDADVEALRQAGYSDDAILEVTLAAAMGEAGRRHDAALRAVFRNG